MPTSTTSVIARMLCCAIVVGVAACSPHKSESIHTVQDLLDDRVTLDGVIMKCSQQPVTEPPQNCAAARIAASRISAEHDAAQEAKRTEDFQHRRDQLRDQQDRQREAAAASGKVDAYHLPVVPVDPVPADKNPQSPMIGQTSTPHE